MPKINVNVEKTKRIDISSFFRPEDLDDSGAYITIKKIDSITKKKYGLYSVNAYQGELFKQLEKKKKSNPELFEKKDLSNDEAFELLSELKLDKKTIDNVAEYEIEKDKMIIDLAVDVDNHNITDMSDNKVKLTADVLLSLGDEKLIKFIVNEVFNFSSNFFLT